MPMNAETAVTSDCRTASEADETAGPACALTLGTLVRSPAAIGYFRFFAASSWTLRSSRAGVAAVSLAASSASASGVAVMTGLPTASREVTNPCEARVSMAASGTSTLPSSATLNSSPANEQLEVPTGANSLTFATRLSVADVGEHADRKGRVDGEHFLGVDPDALSTSRRHPVDLVVVLTRLHFGDVRDLVRLVLRGQVLAPGDDRSRRHVRVEHHRDLEPGAHRERVVVVVQPSASRDLRRSGLRRGEVLEQRTGPGGQDLVGHVLQLLRVDEQDRRR